MKKLILTFICLTLTSLSHAEDFVKIIHQNPLHKLVLHYQICTLNTPNTPSPNCNPITIASMEKGQNELNIPVYNWAFDVIVVKAFEQLPTGAIIAAGFYPGEEDCKGFTNSPITLNAHNSQVIECIRFKQNKYAKPML